MMPALALISVWSCACVQRRKSESGREEGNDEDRSA
jgi:hypothetical protein